jgi:hypothetical protein
VVILTEYDDDLVREWALHAGYSPDAFVRILERAMWEGDIDTLDEVAHCGCCCWEHTSECCPARVWNGCRGSGSLTRAEEESWAAHYERFHSMTREQFFEP